MVGEDLLTAIHLTKLCDFWHIFFPVSFLNLNLKDIGGTGRWRNVSVARDLLHSSFCLCLFFVVVFVILFVCFWQA